MVKKGGKSEDIENAISDIRKKIKELDKLDEEFMLMKREWERIESGEREIEGGKRRESEKQGIFNTVVSTLKPALSKLKPKEKPPEVEEEETTTLIDISKDKIPETFQEEEVPEKPPEKKKISKKKRLNNVLKNLEERVKDIKGSAIVTRDGLIVSSRLPTDVDLNAFGGFSASFFGAAETAIYELKNVPLYDVYIETDEVKVIAVEAGEYAFLVTLVKLDANTGFVLMEMKNSANEVKKIMTS